VAFSGAMTIAFDATGTDDGGVSTTPGTLISLAVVVAGYLLVATQKTGPLATAGVVAFAVALPFFVGYATFDENNFQPFDLGTVLGLSAVGWGVAYAVGPSRGRPFLLGSALLGLWLFALDQVTDVLSSPFDLVGGLVSSPVIPSDEFGGPGFGAPDPTEIAMVCAVFAAIYLLGSLLLDRRGLLGAATPMVAIGHVAAIVAVIAFVDDLEEIGTGLLAIGIGVFLLYRGAATERRGTTWLGGIYLVVGFQSLASGLVDSANAGGTLLIGCGAVLVVLAAFFANVADEPDDIEPGPSFPGGLRGQVVITTPPTEPVPEHPEGWWRASDDNWYPPEQHPGARGDG
jgi:hypothetical protein